ncbi:hypothetical protein [Hydrogenovibrio marinus]|uniref:Uncharacterized protein n=1 Tax=Hydrogenovibrio marinus TaxID=28885 RepID=A0A066ZY29_HYDMR|nr:hypothetical protein [Hydrogenovibrio marinus]KDN95246.1 hypothetical protein EI16_02775 [Hydrogenovibrio marinus]BBN59723.1 hypothetical protein HVMH_1317 [Hydrogenovibrio marinus]
MFQRPIFTSFLLLVLSFGFLNFAHAGQADAVQLTAHEFKNQWDKPAKLDASVQWVIFSHHKDGNEWVRDALNELGIKNLEERHWLYVADISGMPSFVTKLFALPKMRKYDFPIALSDDEVNTQNWPEKEDTVSVYKLENLKIVETKTFPSKLSLEDFLMSISN